MKSYAEENFFLGRAILAAEQFSLSALSVKSLVDSPPPRRPVAAPAEIYLPRRAGPPLTLTLPRAASRALRPPTYAICATRPYFDPNSRLRP